MSDKHGQSNAGRPQLDVAGTRQEWAGATSDTAGCRQAEEALRNPDAKYRTLIESMDEGFCIVAVQFDGQGHPEDYCFLEVNAAFDAQTGLSNVKGQSMRHLNPAQEPYWFEIIGSVVTSGKAIRFVRENKALNRWFDVYAAPTGGPGSNQVAILFRDITRQKRIDDELNRSRERQAFLLKLSDAISHLADPVEIQAEATRILGEQLGVSRVAYGEVADDDTSIVFARNYTAPGVPEVTGRFRLADFGPGLLAALMKGQTIVVMDIATDASLTAAERDGYLRLGIQSLAGVPLNKDGRFVSELVIHHEVPRQWTPEEITLLEETADRTWAAVERARAEAGKAMMLAQVLDEREKLRATISSIDDEVWISDAAGNLVMLNPAAQRAFGLPSEGKPVEEVVNALEILNPDGTPRSPADAPVLKALAGETISGEEIIRHVKTGELRYRRFNSAPIRDSQGRITGSVTVSKDITEAKLAERSLRESEARARDLVRELEAVDRNKNRFISVLSHELRNPLATIVMAQALLKRIPPGSDQAHRAAATEERQTAILTRMVEDLLDVTRISENKIRLKLERLDLVPLVRQTVSDFRSAFEDKGVMLGADLPLEPVWLDADPVRLAQAVSNLLHNALKFTQSGDTVAVTVATDTSRNEAVIQVADTGAGIEPETLKSLFQPFTQADQALARTQGGLGLGLSIVKGMVELHGGYVVAESEGLGKGSAFTIHLPMR